MTLFLILMILQVLFCNVYHGCFNGNIFHPKLRTVNFVCNFASRPISEQHDPELTVDWSSVLMTHRHSEK